MDFYLKSVFVSEGRHPGALKTIFENRDCSFLEEQEWFYTISWPSVAFQFHKNKEKDIS